MSWAKKLRAVCLPASDLFLLFQAACFCPSCKPPPPIHHPLLFASSRHFSDLSFPQRRSHQWFLLFGVNIPNVSLFIYCISAVTERFCRGCVKHAATGNDNTDHNARLEREMLNLTLSSCSVCLGPSHKGFCFRLYNVEKKNNNNNKLLSHLINCILKELVV